MFELCLASGRWLEEHLQDCLSLIGLSSCISVLGRLTWVFIVLECMPPSKLSSWGRILAWGRIYKQNRVFDMFTSYAGCHSIYCMLGPVLLCKAFT